MVKSYLRYLHETTFGTVNSPICKSIESLSPELVFSGTDDFVSLWNCKLNEIKIKFEFKKDEYNPSTLVVCFILTNNSNDNKKNESDHKYLFVGYKDGIIRRFLYNNQLSRDTSNSNDLNNNEVIVVNEDNVLICHKSAITSLSLSINEELLISGSNDGNVLVWNVFDCQLLYKLKGHKNIILSTIYYFNDKLIVNENFKNQYLVDSFNKRSKRDVPNNELNGPKRLENKDELGYVFSMSKDNTIKIWDIINETCINTIIEPLLQLNHFIINSDKLYVNYKNNNVIHCYKINDLNNLELLYKIENQHNYLKSKYLQHVTLYSDNSVVNRANDFSPEDNGVDLLFVSYNKHIYVYKLLKESEIDRRRQKRLRRVNEKLKLKVNKLKNILKLTNRKVDKANLSSSLKSQYKYLKSLLTNEPVEDKHVAGSRNNDVTDRDDDENELEEDKYAHGDYYKLLHVYNTGDDLNFSASGGSSTDSHDNGDAEVADNDENTINSIQIYGYYTVINYNNNITNVYKFNYKILISKMVDKTLDGADDKERVLFEKLYRLNKYHNNSIKLMKLSLDNRKLLTLSSGKILIFNTHNNHVVNYTNGHFYYSQIDNLTENESVTSGDREKEYVHNITNALFINNNNLLLVLKSNRLLLYNLNTQGFYLMTSLNNMVNSHMENEYYGESNKNEIANVYYKSENNEEVLLLVFKYNWVKKINLNTGNVVNELNTSQQITHSQVDGKYVYLGLLNNNILIVFYSSLKIYSTLFGHSLPLTSLAASSDIILLATSSLDKTIKIWDIKFGNILKSLLQHSKTVTQIKFLNNTHYLVSISHDNKIKLYDCDEYVLITEISNFNYPLTWIEMSNYNQFFYVTGSNCYCISKYNVSNDLIFIEEEHEKLQDQQISKELNLNSKILSTLEQLIETLEIDDEDAEHDKLKNINNIVNGINYNLVYNMLLSLPFVNIEQLVQSIISIFEIYLKGKFMNDKPYSDGSGPNKKNIVNLECLIYVSLMISEIYLKQFLNNKTNIYKLKKLVSPVLSNYLEMIHFNKAGLEYIKNLLVVNNNSLKRLI